MKNLHEEFLFIKNKLEDIGSLLIGQDYIEASFMIGQLHSICAYHAEMFKADEYEEGNGK